MAKPSDDSMNLHQDARRFAFPLPDHGTEGHQASIYALDLKLPYLVSGSADRSIRIWDVESQRLVRGPLVGHEGSVICLQSDPEQDVIVSGSTDASLIFWRFSTGEIVKRIVKAHEETVLDLFFDDKYLVTGSKDNRVKIWRRPSTFEIELVATLDRHRVAVNSVLMQSQDDGPRLLFTGSGDHTIHMWSMTDSGSQVETIHIRAFTTHRMGIAAMHLVGDQLISGSSDNTCKIFDIEDGTEVATLQGHSNLIRTVQAIGAADDFIVITGSYDGTIRFWKRASEDHGTEGPAQQWREVRRLEYDGERNPASHDAELAKRLGDGIRIYELRVAQNDGNTRVICAGQENIIVGWDVKELEP